MLRDCVIDFKGNWDDRLALIEFAYNNSYHSSTHMAPYEALYGRRCRSPIGWFEVGEFGLIGPELVHQAMDKVKVIQERIGNVAYKLELPQELATVHPVFHISMLKKYLDRQVRKLRTKKVALVKVLWRNQFVEEATWETEEYMKKRYPHLFEPGEIPDQGTNSLLSTL
ncbi:hypothetical protein MTR67_023144 [Solanum verrucosum]|uniref:Tf2-1-like SH3-like domain-containing protein n=1 Tax=Solanum verrucosum TaxID=315347 RepID=A0AAF0QSY0_SOLVR|nr:hypothetical protein MTR67_023144 [Solanum verrucosum]